jgi:hypothetical protein
VSEAISLKRFLNGLDALLAPLDEQRLRSAVREYARGLPAGARTGFLEDLTAACDPAEAVASDDTELIAAIEAFTADAASGMYYDGWGWDPEVRHERAFGDESWAPRMDTLFDRAAEAFLAGRHELAARAYRLLFATLGLEGEEGPVYSYEFSPAESLMADLPEAGARYLRALYETAATPPEAAAAFARVWLDDLPYGCKPMSLADVRETLPADLAQIEEFCPHWTRELIDRSGGHDRLRNTLLREAALLSGGTGALAEAARHPGPGQPDAYLDLVEALTEAGEVPAALQSCQDGLSLAAQPNGDRSGWAHYQWAPLADRAAALADPEAAVGLRITAFTLATSTARLVALYRAAETHQPGTGPHAAGEAAERLAKGEPGLAHYHLNSFRAQALLLAGHIDDALDLVIADDSREHGSGVILTVLPYVLAASCGAARHPGWPHTVLCATLQQSTDAGRTLRYEDEFEGDDDSALPGILQQLLCDRFDPAADRARRLRLCRAAIDRYAHSVISGKHRASYADAARLAAAYTETEIITDGHGNYLDGLLDTYRRYTALRREADTVRRASVLL